VHVSGSSADLRSRLRGPTPRTPRSVRRDSPPPRFPPHHPNILPRSRVYEGVERALTLPVDSTSTTAAADRAARLGELFDRQQLRLYRLALRMGAEPDDAADLVQDAFLRLARAAVAIPEGAGGEAWLVRALVNLSRDRRRRRAVRVRASLWGSLPEVRPADAESAAAAREQVGTALARLSPRRRAVVVLHEIEGYALVEVARMLGIASVTARWHLSAGRRDLQRLLVGERRGGS